MKLSHWTGDRSEAMPWNSPGGSTLQWGAGRGLMCHAPPLSSSLSGGVPFSERSCLHGHVWDVMLVWRKGNINKNSLCCTIIMVHKDMSSSYMSVDCIGLWSCLVWLFVFQAPLCLRSSWCYVYSNIFFCLHPFLFPLASWAWRDWPLT